MYNFSYFPRHRWILSKLQEKNFLAAFFHMSSITLTCASMAQLGWFHLRGRDCPAHLALYQFFNWDPYGDYVSKQEELFPTVKASRCVTPEIAVSMRIIILLCFMAMFSSFIGFFLDILGPSGKVLRIIKRNAVPSIFTVICIIIIISLCYYITILIESVNSTTHIQVSYEYGTYTITTAGFMAIFATASNLLQNQNLSDDPHRRHLVEDWDGVESLSVDTVHEDHPDSASGVFCGRMREDTPMESLSTASAPPPPYTP